MDLTGKTRNVALLVSAWIEIDKMHQWEYDYLVALLVSAWIEIFKKVLTRFLLIVALLVSAWIEINIIST